MAAQAEPGSILLITNPNSRSRDVDGLRAAIDWLDRACSLIVVHSESPEQTHQAIKRHRPNIQRVILAGGDGTISSAVSLLHELDLPLAILPTGTANDLARALDIPADLAAAAKVAIHGNKRTIDLGVANGKHFVNVAHLGLGVRVTHRLEHERKSRWGVLSYLHAMLSELKRVRGFTVHIEIDGQRHRMKSVQLAVGNGRFYGGGNIVAEQAQPDDGQLHLYSVLPRHWIELLGLAPILRWGRHRNDQRVFSASGQAIRIQTSKPREVHADGEPLTQTPVEFSIQTQALDVLGPADRKAGTEDRLSLMVG